MTTIQKTAVVLNAPRDWEVWYNMVRSRAMMADIWKFIDPSTSSDELPMPTKAPLPLPTDINPDKTLISELTTEEHEELKTRREERKDHNREYDKHRLALESLSNLIHESVSRSYHTYLLEKYTIYDMLTALKQRIAPTDRARQIEYLTQYQKLKKAPQNQNIDEWIKLWETTYASCKKMNLPDVADTRPLYDFLDAVYTLAPEFTGYWRARIQVLEHKSKQLPNIYEILEFFRNNIRLANAEKARANHGAFVSTFQGQGLDGKAQGQGLEGKAQGDETTNGKSNKPCLCGMTHRFKTCWYLIESLRPDTWKPNKEVQQQIDEKLEKSAKLREIIERIQKQAKKDKKDSEASTNAEDAAPRANFMVSAFSSGPSDYKLHRSVILDSGATIHVCNDRARFRTYRPAIEEEFLYAGTTMVPIEGYGDVTITVATPNGPIKVGLTNTAYIPAFHTTVASLNKFVKKGVHLDTQNNRLQQNSKTFCTLGQHYGQWTLEFNELPSIFATEKANVPVTKDLWHQRLGHIGPEAVHHLPGIKHDATRGPKTIECETCSLSKAHQIISRQPQARAATPFVKIHFDLIQMTPGYNGDQWIAHFLCDHTRMNYVYSLAQKSSSLTTMKNFLALVLRRYDQHIKTIRLDGETSLGNAFIAWAADKGIILERSAPYTPAQNGAVERSGKELIQKARSMRIGSNIPEDLWPETFKTAGYLLNRIPSQTLDWKSPLQRLQKALLQEKEQSLDHLRVFGCRAYALKYKIPRTQKTEARAFIGYLVGYDSTNIFKIWIPSKKKVISTRDVTFNETLFYDPREVDMAGELYEEIEDVIEVYQLPSIQQRGHEHDTDTNSDLDLTQEDQDEFTDAHEDNQEQEQRAEDIEASVEGTEPMLPTPRRTPQAGNSSTSATPRSQPSREIIGSISQHNVQGQRRVRKQSEKARQQVYHTALDNPEDLQACYAAFGNGTIHRPNKLHRDDLPEPPNTWFELQSHPQKDGFIQAAKKEYRDLFQRKTFEKVVRPTNTQVLPVRWVFVYKFDTNGYLEKHKSRLCVRGDMQEHTREDNYAATLAARTFRALMAIAAAYDLEAYQYDAVSAFTNSQLDETIYIECPDGFREKNTCLLLYRALYGLRQSPRLWLQDFTSTLGKLGLQQTNEEFCLFAGNGLLVFFYVDDIVALFRKEHQEAFENFIEKLIGHYDLRDMGELSWFLGIRIIRDREQKKIWLCQDSYIKKIAAAFHLEDRRPAFTPMTTDTLLPYDGKATPQEVHAYQRKVGSILYAAIITRPDLARTASKLCEFLQNPSPVHQQAAEQAIVYLNTTYSKAIEYSANESELPFTCASDAAYADNIPSRQSTEGYLFSLFGGPIDWRSTKQKTVTTSSTEAELLAMTHTAKELAWWKRFFSSIEFDTGHDLKIYGDNQQAIRILTHTMPQFSTKLRHIDISRNWLRQEVQAKRLTIEWVPTAHMPADGLTKILTRQKQETFVQQLGLVDIAHLLTEDCISS